MRLAGAARGVLTATAAWFLVTFTVLAWLRWRTPFELEWIEGGMVDQARRILEGHQLYGPPSTTFTPYLYTPLYSYVAAGVSWFAGAGYAPLRLVSLLSSLAAMATVGWWVTRETGERWAGFVAAGFLAACFRVGGSWFDLARVDSLFLALVLAGLCTARFAPSRRRTAIAAAVMVLAVLTKQEALLPALAPLPFLWRRDRSWAAAYAGTLGIGLAAGVVALQASSHGWFLYYVAEVPLAHHMIASEALRFWTRDMLRLAPATAVGAAGLFLAWRVRSQPAGDRTPSDQVWFLGPVWVAMVGAAWSGRVHSGGFDNVLLPALAITAVLLGIGLAWLLKAPDNRTRTARRPWLAGVAALAVLGQFGLVAYNPANELPRRSDATRVAELEAVLRQLPGPVYLPGHGWYLARAGRPTGAQSAAMADVLRGPDGAAKSKLRADLEGKIHRRWFGSVVVDSISALSYLPADFGHYYCRSRSVYAHGRLIPLIGTRTGPLTVWLPCRT